MIKLTENKEEIEKIKTRSKQNLELALTRVKPIIKDIKIFKESPEKLTVNLMINRLK